ncbi:MAG: hypothetical protein FWD58_03940 [Firmicutes bacterium]|nr:hypothetical protein [Bacillota bacterium]
MKKVYFSALLSAVCLLALCFAVGMGSFNTHFVSADERSFNTNAASSDLKNVT